MERKDDVVSEVCKAEGLWKVKSPPHSHDKFPRSRPYILSETLWCYEEKKGFCVIAEARKNDGTHIATTISMIPWLMVLLSAKRWEQAEVLKKITKKEKPK